MGLRSKLKVGSLQKNNECRAVKKFLSSRLIMNGRRLWNSHQRHKFLRAEASRDILKFRVAEMAFFQEEFSTADTMLFFQNTYETRNNAVEMSQAFHDIVWFEHFTDLNLFKYDQCHWKLGNECFTILFDGAYFLSAVMVEGDESSWLKMAN